MKQYLLDQAFLVFSAILFMIIIPSFCGPIFTFIFELNILLSFGFLCRRILILPFDLLYGKMTQVVYFSAQTGREELEFFNTPHCCIWKFYYGSNDTLSLLVPVAVTKNEQHYIHCPVKDQRIKITYYRFSRLLCTWEPV